MHSSSGKWTQSSLNHVTLTETDDSVPASLLMIDVQFSYIDPDTYDINKNIPPDNVSVYSFLFGKLLHK
jgi:hypothetical protein